MRACSAGNNSSQTGSSRSKALLTFCSVIAWPPTKAVEGGLSFLESMLHLVNIVTSPAKLLSKEFHLAIIGSQKPFHPSL